jgi:hypothetical protein
VSPTYLYLLTAHTAPDPPPATVGLDDRPVRRLGDAWVSDVATRTVRATVEHIRAHDTVVAAALGTGSTPLPARFGQTFESDDACARVLAERDSLSAALARVAGMVEMTVLLKADAPVLATASGTAYLESLARREHAIDGLRSTARDVNAHLTGYFRESAERANGAMLTISHLVEREALARYMERVASLKGVTVVGPSAPYSFGQPE